jgi:hypothetical protein
VRWTKGQKGGEQRLSGTGNQRPAPADNATFYFRLFYPIELQKVNLPMEIPLRLQSAFCPIILLKNCS